MKNLLLPIFALFLCLNLSSQAIWNDSDLSKTRSPRKHRESHPSEFRTVSFNLSTFMNQVKDVPLRTDASAARSNAVLSFPLPDGTTGRFRLVDAELMHPDLAAKFPQLKAWVGKGIDDPTAHMRITYSPYFGLNGMILSGKHSTVYIDPITKDNKHYMSYYRDDVEKMDTGFTCHTDETIVGREKAEASSNRVDALGDCNLRRYRLAQSCTGEYAQYHIAQAGGSTGTEAGDKAIVQAAMNVTMNRVNGVFENDMGITMQFIANNDLVIYLDGASDPWTNEWNVKTAETIDAQIGVTNYDIGHNFNDTGGGNAGCLDCVCLSVSQTGAHKGKGYTGRSAPIGDPFDIDYVAHEMGHQFGAYHVQSSSGCRSGSGATEVEPGSGSSIMGYAGICAANVQNQSDDYFAYVNIRDVVTSINGGNGSGCAELIVSGNNGPSADAGGNYTIPASTPFKLEGVGSDPDDGGVTFSWEQNDPENPNSAAAPTPTRAVGPMFRSFSPVAEPYRYFPNLTDLTNNVNPTFEVLPSVSRNMEFSFIVRDNNGVSGCTASDLMSVTTVASAGPFLVTVPNTAVTWDVGADETVTWDVAGTAAAPISCTNVDIVLSTDGGNTYPVTLASGVANDGTHDITVPNNPGTNTRVMIVCSDNIFFDISNTDFTIQTTTPTYLMSAASTTADICPPSNAEFTIDLTSVNGFATDVALSASGVPTGATSLFSTNTVTPTGSAIFIVDSGSADEGSYVITITGVGGGITRTLDLTVNIAATSLDGTTLLSPADAAIDVATSAPLSWSAVSGASTYEVEVASDATFSNIVYTETGLTGTSVTASGLTVSTTYYWRVRGVNSCTTGVWSATWSFTTEAISPCLVAASGPYNNFKNAPCASVCGTPTALPFEVYGNESYLISNVTGGAEYAFEFCNGYNAATWAGNITVAYYEGNAATTNIFTTSGCSATFTTPTDGDIIIIIWTDPCGSAEVATDNGIPTFMCTGNGAIPDCPTCLSEDFEGGQPTDWFFTDTWTFDAGSIGAGATGANSGTGNWAYFNDDVAGTGSVDRATMLSPYFNFTDACSVTMSFDYTYREYNDAVQEFVQFRVFDGTQWQYWTGTAWSATAVNWLSETNETGTFNETLPASFHNGSFQAEFIYDDAGGYEYGFGIDNFSIGNDCSFLDNIPTDGTATSYTADREVTIGDWTHYVDDAGTVGDLCDDMLLLSIKKNGENIGSVGDGTFQCILGVNPTASNISAPYVSNQSGWWTMNRYWNITPLNEPTVDVEVRFYYTELDFTALKAVSTDVSAHEDMHFWKINDNTNAWDINPANGHTGVPMASGHAEDGFQQYANGGTASTTAWQRQTSWAGNADWNYAEYTVGHFGGGGGGGGGIDGDGALPVELLYLKAKALESKAILYWATATEENSSHFDVERSTDGINFEYIGEVEAAGNSTALLDYSLLDEKPVNGVNYYRLKIVDLDGSFEYSNVVSVKFRFTLDISLNPNPTRGNISLIFNEKITDEARLELIDVAGRVILNKIIATDHTYQLRLDEYPSGTYFVRVISGELTYQNKIIKH